MNRTRRMQQKYASETAWDLSEKWARLNLLDVQQQRMMWRARRSDTSPEQKVECVKQAKEWNRLIRRLRFHIRRIETSMFRAGLEKLGLT